MTARDDIADIAADACCPERTPGGEPCPVHKRRVATILDALAERPDLHVRWLQETGALEQVGWWCWWDGDLSRSGSHRYDHPEDGVSVPVFRVVDRSDTA